MSERFYCFFLKKFKKLSGSFPRPLLYAALEVQRRTTNCHRHIFSIASWWPVFPLLWAAPVSPKAELLRTSQHASPSPVVSQRQSDFWASHGDRSPIPANTGWTDGCEIEIQRRHYHQLQRGNNRSILYSLRSSRGRRGRPPFILCRPPPLRIESSMLTIPSSRDSARLHQGFGLFQDTYIYLPGH